MRRPPGVLGCDRLLRHRQQPLTFSTSITLASSGRWQEYERNRACGLFAARRPRFIGNRDSEMNGTTKMNGNPSRNGTSRWMETIASRLSRPDCHRRMSCRFAGDATSPSVVELLADGRSAWSPVPASRFDAHAFYDSDPDKPGRVGSIPRRRALDFGDVNTVLSAKSCVASCPGRTLLKTTSHASMRHFSTHLPTLLP